MKRFEVPRIMARTPVAERLRRHRAQRAADGLRLAQRWVHDLRDPAVRAAFERECQAIAAATQAQADTEQWLDAVRDTDGWT